MIILKSQPLGLRSSVGGLVELIGALNDRFDKLGHSMDLRNAICCQRLAIHLAEGDERMLFLLLGILAATYMVRFTRLGDPADVDKAIGCQSRAALHMKDAGELTAGHLNRLGSFYECRFKSKGDLTDGNKAIAYHIQAMELTPDDHEKKPAMFDDLGNSYSRRFDWYGEPSDINRAIECHIKAVQLTPDGDANKPGRICHLGTSYQCRFGRLGDPGDISKAIECHIQAVELTPDSHADRPWLLGELGSSYVYRYKHKGDRADADKAIEYHVQALQLTPDGHRNKPHRLHELGISYLSRYERHGEPADINMAVEFLSQAVELSPDAHEGKPAHFEDLGSSYLCRFDRQGELSDLDKALECHIQAVRSTPDHHIDKSRRFTHLGNSYMCRFGRHGELINLDKAIECHIQAIQLTPDDDIDKASWLNNLGSSYMRRFEHQGELEDINKSIECNVQAMRLTPDGHARMSTRFYGLGISYMCRFEHHGEVSDFNEGFKCFIRAVELTPDDRAEKPTWLRSLGSSYTRRFELHGELSDLEKAIKCHVQSMELSPDENANQPDHLASLGDCYMSRFKHYEELSDADKAIACRIQALHLTPDGHPNKLDRLYNLGHSCMQRFRHSSEPLDLQTANSSFELAARYAPGHPSTQFNAACMWATCSSSLGLSPRTACQRAIELVPQMVWLGTTIKKRYSLLTNIGDFVIQAASSAIVRKEYECALEWLEQGRSVVWNQILQLRTPFDALHAVDPALAKRLKEVSAELELAGSRPATASLTTKNHLDLEKNAQRHRRLATEWDQLLEQTRQLPGFTTFMQPRKADALVRAAKDGPIIVINSDPWRCNALIVRPDNDEIAHLPLSNFSPEKADSLRLQLMSLIGHRGGRSRGFKRSNPEKDLQVLFKQMLANLWLDIVKPVLDFLGYTYNQSTENMPHVTWCTTGPLSFLPLHAAGLYDGSQPNAFELVVSSYTPTLGALLAPNCSVPDLSGGILAIGQQYTAGFNELPNTAQELAAIRKHAKATRFLQLDGENATVDAVLNAMDEYSCVHLACHATQDREDPSQSAFHLCDGDLTLSMITQRSYKNKGLAFLSACQTATGDEKLPDESVHLAAGMLMAGYPSVIATMWAIRDEDAPDIARHVYANLLKGGGMDCKDAAGALHKAVAQLRMKVGESSFERWVPFIHMGS